MDMIIAHGWMDGWMDEDEWTDEWMDGMDG